MKKLLFVMFLLSMFSVFTACEGHRPRASLNLAVPLF